MEFDMPADFAPYRKLLKRAREISFLASSASALGWDVETYMPAKGLPFRAEQMAYLGGQTHRLFTAKSVGRLIAECEQHGFAPDTPEAANVREWRRRYDRATKVPPRLVEKLERVRTLAREAWKNAREQSHFRLFKPHLQKIVDLSRQMADCWGFKESPYDALLEGYEHGVTAGQLRRLFDTLRPEIGSILPAAVERSAAIPADFLDGHYPVAAQQAFNRKVAGAFGFDFEAGRIDTTTHPFCETLGPADCRLTTRYDEKNFAQSLLGVLHEAGHGMYEQGLPYADYGTPNGTAVSLGVHESQSRLWENHVGRSTAFWEHWHPVACDHFPELKRFSPAQVSAAVNRVAPSFHRVEADQVTYDLHIILRFELEVRMIQGDLKVAEVPACWNEEFKKMLGLEVEKDSDGCLQDIHWAIGLLGYFPTYTLGNLNAAQLMHRAAVDNPSLEIELGRGEYGTLLKWLRVKVHCHGSRYSPQELITRATGEGTQSRYHLDCLRAKYAGPSSNLS
jgi:carboxypeptidase Taq